MGLLYVIYFMHYKNCMRSSAIVFLLLLVILIKLRILDLRKVLPEFHQHVHFPTRESNTLDRVYTNIPGSYKAFLLPHFGLSDHSFLLPPAYLHPADLKGQTNSKNGQSVNR